MIEEISEREDIKKILKHALDKMEREENIQQPKPLEDGAMMRLRPEVARSLGIDPAQTFTVRTDTCFFDGDLLLLQFKDEDKHTAARVRPAGWFLTARGNVRRNRFKILALLAPIA